MSEMKNLINCGTCGYPLTPEERTTLVEHNGVMYKQEQIIQSYLEKDNSQPIEQQEPLTWVSLTDEQMRKICGSVATMKEAVREAEAILIENNTK